MPSIFKEGAEITNMRKSMSASAVTLMLSVFLQVPLAPPVVAATQGPIGYTNDFGMWMPMSVKFPIRRKVQGYFEVQPRLQQSGKRDLSETQVRTGVGYEFSKHWSVFAGYFWSMHSAQQIIDHEHRLWQQLTYSQKLGDCTLQSRFRSEEIWRQSYEGALLRVRNQFRLTRPIKGTPYYIAVSEEPFFNVNSRENGPLAGFAQNRAFVGMGKKLNQFARIEFGYMNQYRNSRNTRPDIMNHILIAQLSVDFCGERKQFKLARKPEQKYAVAYVPQIMMSDITQPAHLIFDDAAIAHTSPEPALHPALSQLASHRHSGLY